MVTPLAKRNTPQGHHILRGSLGEYSVCSIAAEAQQVTKGQDVGQLLHRCTIIGEDGVTGLWLSQVREGLRPDCLQPRIRQI